MERLTFAEWIRLQALQYRALDTEAGEIVAEMLDGLAADAEFVHAESPGQLRDRLAILAS